MNTLPAIAHEYFINDNIYIGLDGYYYEPENNEVERMENFEYFEDYLKQERAKGVHFFTSYILYCFKELNTSDFNDEKFLEEYPLVKNFISKNQNKISAFLNKWFDETTQTYNEILDLADAVETQEPHQVIIQGNSGYIVGIEFYSERMKESYWFDYMPTKRTYQDVDELQMFIPKVKYEELMTDLYKIFEE